MKGDEMKPKKPCKKWFSMILALGMGMLMFGTVFGYAEVAHFGINLSNDKEPVELYANSLEIRDKEGIALFNGDVSVIQGKRLLRTAKLVIYYDKAHKDASQDQGDTKASPAWFGSTGIKKMEALGKVYIKNATQIATGDKGVFDGKSKIMRLTGNNVVLTDGDNVATGCKLTADMKSGKAFLEGCETSDNKSRVSIIFKQNQKNGH
ncbi:lipopolysaccharide transport periplasmic protein LptA [Bartonella vinsonii subsp. arupensis OK-94-513]|uniref:Lipopolysaccharide transport periplasmic protein LptA n=3 Tax=Bartonella vinsonii TaxID=33047 RepID=J0ZM84_BARVI|nr:lipopolysaccharide transport periplasmic protein LptA [Bartonella vinsonii subsp. arupensis OK-94-513]EJF98201.1 lipopolysaccharide transport periplasmic protein LptA [Bartonella vinsonii subsp. arupensis Pm136co]